MQTTPNAPRTDSQISAEEMAEIVDAARYLKDVAYSTENLGLSKRARASLISPLGKSGRDTMLMAAFGITREVAHTINNRLDARQPHSLRAIDMEDAFTMFPALRALVDEAAARHPNQAAA